MSTTTDSEVAAEASGSDHIPIDGVGSVLDVLQDPSLLREWVETLSAPNLEHSQQEGGGERAHTLGENMVRNLDFRRWPGTLESLEKQQHPATGEPPHAILQHPKALLDCIVHLSETDGYRLSYNELSRLPRTRRQVFEWLLDEDTPVGESDLEAIGGTDALIYGPMGRGKTTLVLTLVARILEINNEAVVWRGTSSRTEWLPLAPWATLCLPSGVGYEASLAPPEDGDRFADIEPVSVDLDALVRDVRYYDNIVDLNENILEPGAFHVVYPDPKFRQADAVTKRSESKVLEHTSAWDALRDGEATADDVTPTKFWWFPWILQQLDGDRALPVTWVCDEVSALLPSNAEKVDHNLPRRIRAIAERYVDVRRNGLSFFLVGHNLSDVHWRIAEKMRWGVTVSGKANPVNQEVLSLGNPPMERDYTTEMDLGKALYWTAQGFTEFQWADLPERHKVPGKLRLRFSEVEGVKERC